MMSRQLAMKFGATIFCVSGSLFAATELTEGVASLVVATPQQRTIKHNPFTKPEFGKRGKQTLVEEQEAPPQVLLQLRAVLYSATTPLVNINGTILAPGEEIDGFLLQEVSEGGAILVKDEVQIMLSMAQE